MCLLVLLAPLAVVDTAALLLTGALLLVEVVALCHLRAVVLRRQATDDGVRAEAAQGQAALERWLASREAA